MCPFFRSKDEDLNVASVDEFYKEAPRDMVSEVCRIMNTVLCVI